MGYTKLLVGIAVIIGVSTTIKAQDGHTQLRGKIVEKASGDLQEGIKISILNTNRFTYSGLDGSFNIKDIRPGTYTVRLASKGFQTFDTTINLSNSKNLALSIEKAVNRLEEIRIQSNTARESESSAKLAEKNADNIKNIVAARAIELSPDVTIANVLQRVSGMSVERSSNGDGRYAIIRGMDQRYNYTLINGIKIPSPDNKYRYVPLDIFPSDLVERVEVYKTLTPAMEGDAVGGVVNMVMKNAPSRFYLKGSIATGVSQSALDNGYDRFPVSAIHQKSPYQQNGPAYQAQPTDFTRDNLNYKHVSAPFNTMATLAVGNRFFNDKLGVMLGASYQNLYKAYHNVYIPAESPQDDSYLIKHVYNRQYSNQLTRTGANLKLDYNFNPNHRISLYSIYANLKDAQTRMTQDTFMPPPSRTVPGTGQIWYFGRSKYQEQTLYNTTLQGEHHFWDNSLKIDWSAVYSKATNKIPDWAEYEYDGGIYATPGSTDPTIRVQPNVLQAFTRDWWRNDDRDWAGYLNANYSNTLHEIPYTLSIGGMYRDKHRTNYYDSYKLAPTKDANGDNQTWVDIYNYNWYVMNPAGSPSDANNYTAEEKIKGAYAMVKFTVKKLETTGGVRMENTDQSYMTAVPETQAGKYGSTTYTDCLPSVNFKYKLNNKTNLRLAYYASISRPGFFEIVPFGYKGDDFDERGNPNLQHTTANNVDFRYELFPKSNEQFLLGAFYKSLKNPIEYGFNFTGQQAATVYQPNNYGNANNYGFEFVYEKYIKHFGFRANYTYTHSSITTTKVDYKIESGIPKTINPSQTRPLQGQSAHIANATLMYKNTRSGTDVQFNWQFTGKRIALVSPYYDMDYWQKGMHLFDLSGEQEIVSKLYLFAKVQNLFNASYKVYINRAPANKDGLPYQDAGKNTLVSGLSQYGQSYILGIRFDLTK